jgi:abequosyltransferase
MSDMSQSAEGPLLTIAIPTYNRREYLTQLLTILAPQLADESRVELIVSDNASADDTTAVVASFREGGLALTYSRNDTNVGPDANFIRCYEMARGEYVWIFGDDDIIVPGGLREVLSRLETRKFDILHIQARGFRGQYKPDDTPKFSHKMKVFARPEDFALHVSTGLTFTSGIIVRKAALNCVPHEDPRRLIGTNLVQLSWTFPLIHDNPRCACLLDSLVASCMENSGGYGAFQVFGTNLQSIVKSFFGLQSPVGRAILNRTIEWWYPWALLQSRRGRHNKHLQENSAIILSGLYRNNPRYWFFLYPLLRLPLPLAEVWLLALRVVNRVDRLLGYPISR